MVSSLPFFGVVIYISEFSVGEEDAVFAEGDDAVGWGRFSAADGAGVHIVNAIFVLLARYVGMAEEEQVGAGVIGEVF